MPLVVEEPTSLACRRVLRADSAIVVWALARVEVHSALQRLRRMRLLDGTSLRRAQLRLDRLSRRWDEVVALGATRDEAERALEEYSTLNLRAANAVQLGAALVSCEGRPRPHIAGQASMDQHVPRGAALFLRRGEFMKGACPLPPP